VVERRGDRVVVAEVAGNWESAGRVNITLGHPPDIDRKSWWCTRIDEIFHSECVGLNCNWRCNSHATTLRDAALLFWLKYDLFDHVTFSYLNHICKNIVMVELFSCPPPTTADTD
jgi:hypothetical protein